MQIRTLHLGPLRTNCYIIKNTFEGKEFLLIIDPAAQAEKIKKTLDTEPFNGEEVTHIVLTHAHFDHIGAVNNLLSLYKKCKLYVGEAEDVSLKNIKDTTLKALGAYYFNKIAFENDRFSIQAPFNHLKDNEFFLGFTVLHTPGHTNGSISLYSKEEKVLFSGDTLFKGSYGRTDLGGNESDMTQSLRKLLMLPEDVTVYSGHGDSTTIGEERKHYCRELSDVSL